MLSFDVTVLLSDVTSPQRCAIWVLTTRRPSGLNTALRTGAVCSLRAAICLACLNIPNAGRPVIGCRYNAPTIGTEGSAPYRRAVSLKDTVLTLTCIGVADDNSIVIGHCDQSAIGAKGRRSQTPPR